jgi:hypothetical protein
MDVTFDRSNYALQDPVVVRAVLMEGGQVQAQHTLGGGPITGATVTADVTLPGSGSTQTIQLTHSGNGVYTGTFTNTSAGGPYGFTLRANGVTSLQAPFTRQTIQSVYVVPAYRNAVLFAADSVSLDDYSKIITGDVLVNRRSQSGDPGVELLIDPSVMTPAGYSLKADRIKILAGATVASDVYFNQLSNAGTITGHQFSSVTLPVDAFPPFEAADPGTATAANVTGGYLSPGQLSPGVYGNLTVLPLASLTLKPGSYSFKSIWLTGGAKLYFTGATRIRVRNSIDGELASYIGPPPSGAGASPSDVVFFVQGKNSDCSRSNAVDIDPRSTIYATMYAPNGTVLLGYQTKATGAFLGKNIHIGRQVQLTLASAFGTLTKPSADGQGSDQSLAAATTPKTYVVSQNYPNPFNPTTQISYGLPKASHVTLTIYNALGQEITRLVDDVQPEGFHEVRWNGLNSSGATVGTGIYFYQLRADDFVQVKKMILMK